MNYTDQTIRDKNPIKRFLQRRRLTDALRVLRHLDPGYSGSVLDFGAGNGELSRLVAGRFPNAKIVCYEPAPKLFEEARRNLSGTRNVVFAQSFEDIRRMRFEHAFCLEVFEHLPPRESQQAINRLNKLLVTGGHVDCRCT